MVENYELKPGVILSHRVKTKLKKIADKYYSLTKKKIVVTRKEYGVKSFHTILLILFYLAGKTWRGKT